MPASNLPERASLEYLKKLAKDRLQDLRRSDPNAKLATALLLVARDHGFSSWRALKAEVDRRQANRVTQFFERCASGDAEAVRRYLSDDRNLAQITDPSRPHAGWTGLHEAAKRGHVTVVRVLLQHGADPNARETGDNTYPLHWAAAHGHLEVVRALLDAGGDVHGFGDVHALDVIGWATLYRAPGDDPDKIDASRRELVAWLLECGARHHVFSAMAIGDVDVVRNLVEQNPEALDRRLSRFEHGLTPVHFAVSRKRHDLLELLIELGADLEATDASGQMALSVAMLQGDHEAMRRLHAAGAKPPAVPAPSEFTAKMAGLAASVTKIVPSISVPDVAQALDWYTSIGFKEVARYEDDGLVNFGILSFGNAELTVGMDGQPGEHDVSLWFSTNQVDALYQLLKSRQMSAAHAALAGEGDTVQAIHFEQDIENMFYGARQFCIRDLNGYQLYFIQPIE
jgi:ankyrin repeat protein/catechol 2,3-dioxygenase-like lactoylglutathione lyase family enzyme